VLETSLLQPVVVLLSAIAIMTLCDLKNLFVLPAQTICEEARKFPIDVIGQMIVQQGKYKGKTVEVAAQDSKYLKWVQSHTNPNDLKWCLLHA